MNPRRVLRTGGLLALLLIAQVMLAACGSTGAAPGGSGGDKVKIGFIYVGPTDDYGYNYNSYNYGPALATTMTTTIIKHYEHSIHI